MRSIRFAVVLALLFAIPSSARADDNGRWGLDQIQDQINLLRAEVARLAELAQKDPRELLLAKYRAFTADDWANKKREPEAEEIVEWVFNPKCDMVLRQAAATALIDANFKDPDLDSSRKSGRQSARAKFSERHIVTHLDDKDAKNRKLADHLLKKFWGTRGGGGGASAYRWEQIHKRTWKPARKAWKKFLDDK